MMRLETLVVWILLWTQGVWGEWARPVPSRMLNGTTTPSSSSSTNADDEPVCFSSKTCSSPYYSLLPEDYEQGTCVMGKCVCKNGWTGRLCDQAPAQSYFSCDEARGLVCKDNLEKERERLGGNLTVTIREARDLPDMDGFWKFAAETDAYVRVTLIAEETVSYQIQPIEKVVLSRETTTIRNDLNPKWPNNGYDLEFGVQLSGMKLHVEVFDRDNGLELGDDYVGGANISVIPCAFAGFWSKTKISRFPKENHTCIESVWVPLKRGYTCDGSETNTSTLNTSATEGAALGAKPCILIQQTMTAFRMDVNEVFALSNFEVKTVNNETGLTETTVVSTRRNLDVTMAGQYNKKETSGSWGRPYTDQSDTLVNGLYPEFEDALGSIMLQTHSKDKDLTSKYYVNATVNYPAEIYIFRKITDYQTVPLAWMDGYKETETWLTFQGQTGDRETSGLKGYVKNYSACENKWFCTDGRDETYPIVFGGPAHGYAGRDITQQMYIVMAKLIPYTPFIEPTYDLEFSREEFFQVLFQYLFPMIFFTALVFNFLGKINMRLDRIDGWLATYKSKPYAESNIAAGLFEPIYMIGPDNAQFRRNVFWARQAIKLITYTPAVILLSFGVVCLLRVQPPAMGLALLLIGAALAFVWMGATEWVKSGYRMSAGIQRMFALAFVLVYIFAAMTVFFEPRVYFGKQPISMFGTTCVFFTLNLMPLIVIVFVTDVTLAQSFKQLTDMVVKMQEEDDLEAQFELLMGLAAEINEKENEEKKKIQYEDNKYSFSSLMKDVYTVNPDKEGGWFTSSAAIDGSFFSGDAATKAKFVKRIYGFSVVVLIVYSIIVYFYANEFYKFQGMALTFCIWVLDYVVYLNHRGSNTWTPGRATMLMVGSRMSMAIFVGPYWLVGVCGAYTVFGIALATDIVDLRLQTMSINDIGALVFFGKDRKTKEQVRRSNDASGMPEFILGFLSLSFLVLLLILVFITEMPKVQVGQQQWPIFVFGVASFLAVIILALSLTAIRAFQLESRSLLNSDKFLFYESISFPWMMTGFVELFTFLSGALLYAITQSSFLFVVLLTAPPIFGLSGGIYIQWVHNDYDFIPSWNNPDLRPKLKKDGEDSDDEDSDDDELADENQQDATAAFKLPPLKKAMGGITKGIKMPALPMRSPFGKKDKKKKKKKKQEENSKIEEKEGEGGTGEDDNEEGKTEAKEGDTEETTENTEEEEKDGEGEEAAEEEVDKSIQAKKKLQETEPCDMLPLEAFLKGKLAKKDYIMMQSVFLLFFLTWATGMLFTFIEQPYFFGLLWWTGSWTILLTGMPIVKWFGTYEVTIDMILSGITGMLMLSGSAFLFFWYVLQNDFNSTEALWTLWAGIGWPTILCAAFVLTQWSMNSWKMTRPLKLLAILWVIPVTILWIVTCFLWASVFLGLMQGVVFILVLSLLIFLEKWSSNDQYLPPRWITWGYFIIDGGSIFALVASVIFPFIPLFYLISMGFLLQILRHSLVVGTFFFRKPPKVVMYFSPFVFPMYMYDADSGDIKSIDYVGKHTFYSFGILILWGVACIIFVPPIGFGIGLVCFGLIATAGLAATLISKTPAELGSASRCIDEEVLNHSAEVAKERFNKRREKIKIENQEWMDMLEREAQEKAMLAMYDSPREEEKDEEKTRRTTDELASRLNEIASKITYITEEDEEGKKVTRRRTDAPYRLSDAFWEALKEGKGILGWVFLFGGPFLFWEAYFTRRNKVYNADGSRIKPKEFDDMLDVYPLLAELPIVDKELDKEFFEETRALMHFQVVLLVEASVRIRKEATQFQRFLRENRFRLLANGVKPPKDIFKSRSYATINIEVVANWLVRLTPEQRERFIQLKDRFSEEQAEKDHIKDQAEDQAIDAKEQIRTFRQQMEEWKAYKRYEMFQARRLRRKENNIEVPEGETEEVTNAKEILTEISNNWSCQPGIHGRQQQFHDPEFAHDFNSIGECEGAQHVVEWKVASGININAGLFEGGTDPDDVFQGVLWDAWLLSAIQILSASGGVGDEEVDELVGRLFVNKDTSEEGAYAIKMYVNGQWEVVIVDDFFPVMDNKYKTDRCAGAAFAHSKDFEELWVPLLEKAFAKYYGGYANIQHGTVDMALTNLTGAESEQISLLRATRGANKMVLWNTLLQYKKNGYLLGCGSVAADTADREIKESGIVFGAAYTIYEVRQVEIIGKDHCLLKLRNPPGDHGEWQGDWSDKSTLWTRWLKKELGWTDEDDGCFWMSFDDFCLSFQYLYVCRYYDPGYWKKYRFDGRWENQCAAGLPGPHNPDCILENNPQYAIHVKRPTDFCFHFKQVENMVVTEPPKAAVIFLVEQSKYASRAVRVTELNNNNVLTYSGHAIPKREYRLYKNLEPGHYVVLCATFFAGREGPFELTVHANHEAKVTQLWPSPYAEGEGPPLTFKEKLMKKAEDGMKIAMKFGEAKFKEYKKKAMSEMDKHTDWRDKDAEEEQKFIELKEEEEAKKKHEELKAKCPWVKQFDPSSNRDYFYNTETGISQWDRPDDYVEGGKSEEAEAATAIQSAFRGKKARKKVKKSRQGVCCNICSYNATRAQGVKGRYEELIKCAGTCGSSFHPGCVGFSEDRPPPDPYYCSLCDPNWVDKHGGDTNPDDEW